MSQCHELFEKGNIDLVVILQADNLENAITLTGSFIMLFQIT